MGTMAAMAKGFININFIKTFNIQKPSSSITMRRIFLTFTQAIYFFSLTKNKAIEPITGAIASVINADW